MPFASKSVSRHLVRGAVGLLALVAGLAGAAAGAPAMLALLLVTVTAWRGCPMCWTIGLLQTHHRQSCNGPMCR